MCNIIEDINKKAEEVEKTLKELMKSFKPVISKTLFDSMEYSLFSGGKRIRPVLAMYSAEIVNGDQKTACKVGSALELIHTYSLIHDDLPSMDDDDYRRGEKANHIVYGPGIAILAGDGLLTGAFEILSDMNLEPTKKIKIIKIISKNAGANGMVGGQVLDLESEDKDIEIEDLKNIHLAKTGALFKAAILAGAYTANPTKKEIEAFKIYSEKLGLLFQITDDILDIIGDEKKLGKAVGSDDQSNKSTYPKILGLNGAKKEAEKMFTEAQKSLNIFEGKATKLNELAKYVLNRDH
ncbi:MAG TPA: farnesyl diphosphate synthase [Halanaerobiales bacterium]|nr:farnesyl diphosphate synthase [Halanaerobiales bacterium]